MCTEQVGASSLLKGLERVQAKPFAITSLSFLRVAQPKPTIP